MEKYVVFDIETKLRPDANAYLSASVTAPVVKEKAPAAITKIQTPEIKAKRLAEWLVAQEKKREEGVAKKVAKRVSDGALHWWTSSVIVIAMIDRETNEERIYDERDEKALLGRFFDDLSNEFPRHTMVGKHSILFDIPFLRGRAMAHNLGITDHLRVSSARRLHDVNQIFSSSSHCAQIGKLDEYAFGLGIPGKTGHGADVAALHDLVLEGNESARQTLNEYCMRDTRIALQILNRYLKEYVPAGLRSDEGPHAV